MDTVVACDTHTDSACWDTLNTISPAAASLVAAVIIAIAACKTKYRQVWGCGRQISSGFIPACKNVSEASWPHGLTVALNS